MENKEEIIIKEKNGKYEIKQTMVHVEEQSKVREILKQIQEGIKAVEKELVEEPVRFELMLKEKQKSLELLKYRESEFNKVVSKFPEEPKDVEEKNPLVG